MRNLFKFLLMSVLVISAVTVMAFAEAEIPDEHLKNVTDAKEEQISILCVGNSILAHGPSEGIGWSGNWGMAASSEENDYYHLLQNKVKSAGYENVVWSRVGVASLERAIDTRMDYDYKTEIDKYLAPAVLSSQPDVVIFQIGENVNKGPSRASYEVAMTKLAEYCKSVNPDVEIVFCMPFWGGNSMIGGVKDAAMNLGYTYANLSQLNTSENKAVGLFEHSGVAAHPGDLGMYNIAELIFEQLNIILERKLVGNDQVQVKLDGQYLNFDVPACIINGRTMIPARAVSEAFDADVDWDEVNRRVLINTQYSDIVFTIGQDYFTKNNSKYGLDTPALIIDGRTLVPLRAVSVALDCNVDWDKDTRTAIIVKPENAPVYVTSIDGDNCNDLNKFGFKGSSSEVTVKTDEGSTNKYFNVQCNVAKNVWTYIRANMLFKANTTYEIAIEAKALDKDGAGNTVDKVAVGLCMRHDGKDHAVKVTDIKVSDGWTRITAEYTVPENFMPNYENDSFGVYANPINGIGASFAVDNITVKEKAEKSEVDAKSAEFSKDSFVSGNGYSVKGKDGTKLTKEEAAVTVVDTDDGVQVSHGGYYNNGVNWGGVALRDKHLLDGFSVTVRFDTVPEVVKGEDCWISIDFLGKPELFQVGKIPENPGFVNLVRFSNNKWEIYNGFEKWANVKTFESATDMFAVKSGDVITMSAQLSGDNYTFTFTNAENSVSYKYMNSDFTAVFEDGMAHLVISASCNGTSKDAFKYTITAISYVK